MKKRAGISDVTKGVAVYDDPVVDNLQNYVRHVVEAGEKNKFKAIKNAILGGRQTPLDRKYLKCVLFPEYSKHGARFPDFSPQATAVWKSLTEINFIMKLHLGCYFCCDPEPLSEGTGIFTLRYVTQAGAQEDITYSPDGKEYNPGLYTGSESLTVKPLAMSKQNRMISCVLRINISGGTKESKIYANASRVVSPITTSYTTPPVGWGANPALSVAGAMAPFNAGGMIDQDIRGIVAQGIVRTQWVGVGAQLAAAVGGLPWIPPYDPDPVSHIGIPLKNGAGNTDWAVQPVPGAWMHASFRRSVFFEYPNVLLDAAIAKSEIINTVGYSPVVAVSPESMQSNGFFAESYFDEGLRIIMPPMEVNMSGSPFTHTGAGLLTNERRMFRGLFTSMNSRLFVGGVPAQGGGAVPFAPLASDDAMLPRVKITILRWFEGMPIDPMLPYIPVARSASSFQTRQYMTEIHQNLPDFFSLGLRDLDKKYQYYSRFLGLGTVIKYEDTEEVVQEDE